MVLCSVRLPAKVKDLWRSAAAREEVSQSEFLREAIRDKAKGVLLGEPLERVGRALRFNRKANVEHQR